MSKNVVIGIVVVLVLVIAGWWMFSSQKNAAMTPAATPTPEATAPTTVPVVTSSSSSAAMMATNEIKVSGGDFTFTPSKLTAKKGEKVKITFQNTGKFPHNLMVDKLGVGTKTVGPGESDSVEFTADTAGTFAIFCSVDSHRQKGMEGTLTVQ